MIAAIVGAVNCVTLLVDKEGGLQDRNGKTALMYAVEHSNYSCIDCLWDKERGMVDADGQSALHIAARVGHVPSFHAVAQYEASIHGEDVRAMLLNNKLGIDDDKKTELLVHLATFADGVASHGNQKRNNNESLSCVLSGQICWAHTHFS